MPLNANFIADFSSFLDATKTSIAATHDFERAAAGVGPALDQSLGQVGASVDDANEKFFKLGQGIGGALASQELRNLTADVKSFATTYINEYAEAEAATARLTAALRASGETSPAVAEQYGEMATALQKMSTFSDEAITDAQTLFTTVGNIKPDNMEDTLKATMDLAHGMGIDLAGAANLVAKAAASDGEALGKLKVILGDSIDEGADFAEVMEAVNSKFGGQSLAALETTAGSMENMKNQMSDVNEGVGQVFADMLGKVLDLFQAMPEGLQTFIIAAVGIGTALAPVLVSLSSLIGLLSTTGLGAGIVSAFTSILAFLGPAGWIALGVIALATIVYKYWDEIVAVFSTGAEKVGKILKGWANTITETVSSVYNTIRTFLVDKLAAVFEFVSTLPGRVVDAFKSMGDAVVFHSIVPDMVDQIGAEFRRLERVMVTPTIDAAKDVMAGFASMDAPTLQPTLAAGAAGARAGGGPVTVTVNMTGMMATDDPQTRAMIRDVISDAVMQGMRGSRLMGTA